MNGEEIFVDSAGLETYHALIRNLIQAISTDLNEVKSKVSSMQEFIDAINTAGEVFVVSKNPADNTK